MKNKSKSLLTWITFILALILLSNLNITKAETEFMPNISTCGPYMGNNSVYFYTGEDIKGEICFNRDLKEGVDYRVKYISTDLKYPGVKKLTVEGIHNYIGSVDLSYTIRPSEMKDFKVTDVTESTITVTWKPYDSGAKNCVLALAEKEEDWIHVIKTTGAEVPYTDGTYTFKNLNGGSRYQIVAHGAYSSEDDGKNYIGEESSVKTITTPNRVKNLKADIINTEQTKITWSGNKKAKYEVYYRNDKAKDWTKAGETDKEYFDINTSDLTGAYEIKVLAYIIRDEEKVYSEEAIYSRELLPSAPSQSIIEVLNNALKLRWSSKEDVKGYIIYRKSTVDTGYKKIATLNGSVKTYTDKNVVTGRLYSYKIVAFNESTYNVYYSKDSNIRTRIMVITPSISITSYSKSAKISWSKVTNTKGYRIYRATSAKGPYYLVKTIKGSSTLSYTDKNLAKYKNYYYKVRTYYPYNSKTYYSNYSSYVTKQALAKTNFKSVTYSSSKYNKLTWGKVEYATKYQVWRSTSKNGTYKVRATVKSTTYKDKSITPGVTYYYKIRACRGNLRGQYSTIKTRTTGHVAQQLNIVKLKKKSTGDKTKDAMLEKMIKKAITRESMSNYEKAKAIYAYVQKNLNTKDGCNSKHFAGTYCELLRYIGINANCVSGKLKTSTSYRGHVWVEYTLNGTTYILDPYMDNANMKKNKNKVQYQVFLKTKSSLASKYKNGVKSSYYVMDILTKKVAYITK